LISNFRSVLNVVCFLLGNFILHTYPSMKMEQTVFRNVGIQNSDAGELPRRKHTRNVFPAQYGLSLFRVNVGI